MRFEPTPICGLDRVDETPPSGRRLDAGFGTLVQPPEGHTAFCSSEFSLAPLPPSDADLIRAAAEGSNEAMAALYDRYSALLFALAMRLLRSPSEAEDLMHDVFVEVWQTAAAYEPSRGSVRAWLMVKLRCRGIDRIRRTDRRRLLQQDLELEAAEPGFVDPGLEMDCARVRHALELLPEQFRDVLVLTYFRGLSSSQIAEELSLPLGTVKSRVAAARKRLRDLVETQAGSA